MKSWARHAGGGVAIALAACVALCAQDWKTATALPRVDLSKLAASQQAVALKILRQQGCSCGCSMKLAECRIVDPNCAYSTGLAAALVDALAQGKSESQAIQALADSPWSHVAEPKLLSDPVSIPTSGAPSMGPEKSGLTMVEFSDFQCPYCAAAVPQINAILKQYPQAKLIFKQYPLEIHPQANLAAAAAVAAQKQGKFWPMHDALFAHHSDLSRANILTLAGNNGLDVPRFEKDLDSTDVRETVLRDVQDGDHAGVEGTPTLFINGQRYNGPVQLESLKSVLDDVLKQPGSAVPASRPAR